MVRKTRRQTGKQLKGVYTIPELRRSFEHIESFVDRKIYEGDSKEKLVKELKKEWSHVFLKELDTKSAEAFINSRFSHKQTSRRKTIRHRGGAGPISGAPLDYTTRAGMYLAPGQIPDKNGHLPLSDGAKSNFGSYVEYVDKGFSVGIPEPGYKSDPVPGQTRFPTSVPVGMGSNEVHFSTKGGSRRKSRKLRRGGAAIISQAFMRPIPASTPPQGVLRDMQDM